MAALIVTALRCPDGGAVTQLHVDDGEVTLGRSLDCTWPLPDPRKSLSRLHCRLECVAGAWQVRDLSTYGTFVNLEPRPIGREQVHALRDGDCLRLGDYEFEVRLDHSARPAANAPGGVAVPRPFGDAVRPFGAADRVFPDALPAADLAPPLRNRADQPFGAGNPGLNRPPPFDDTDPNEAPAGMGAFVPPPAVPAAGEAIIPDDWHSMFGAQRRSPAAAGTPPPAPPSPPAFASAAAPPLAPPVFTPPPQQPFAEPAARAPLHPIPDHVHFGEPARTPPPTPVADPRAAAAAPPAAQPAAPRVSAPPVEVPKSPPAAAPAANAALAALLAGAGLPPEAGARAAADPEAVFRNAGALLIAAVTGVRALLIARGEVKREFRIDRTMLRTRENNPIKFAPTDDLALAGLLDPRGNPVRHLEEAVRDLTTHEVAVLAAAQAAARALLDRLDPRHIEAENPSTGKGLFSEAIEKRLWQSYKARHEKVLAQFEDDFESAFGVAFARAYEEAVGAGKR